MTWLLIGLLILLGYVVLGVVSYRLALYFVVRHRDRKERRGREQ